MPEDVKSPTAKGNHKVWTLDGNEFIAHPVKTGITDGINTEVTGGLTEGTTVITETAIEQPEMAEEPAGDSERSPFMPGPLREATRKRTSKRNYKVITKFLCILL